PKRFLPKMLQDPSHEIRRDAVDLAIESANALPEKDVDARKQAYRRALKGACDQDQIEVIVKALDKLGDKIDVVAHLGFVTSWHLVAPFDNTNGGGFAVAYPPEKGVDLADVYDGKGGEKIEWKPHVTRAGYGMVDLNAALAKFKGAVAYAHAVV